MLFNPLVYHLPHVKERFYLFCFILFLGRKFQDKVENAACKYVNEGKLPLASISI